MGTYQNGAELWSNDFWVGVGTGALIGGAAGALVGLGGAFVTGGLLSVAGKAAADITSIALFGTSYESFGDYLLGEWQNYGVAFAVGGLLKGLPLEGIFGATGGTIVKFAGEVGLQPAFSQLATMGVTPGTSFNVISYTMTVITRAATFGISTDSNIMSEMLGYAIMKGMVRGFANGIISKYLW